MLDSIDHWLLNQPSLINARKRALVAAVQQRQQLADSFARHLALLGLKQRAAPVTPLAAYLASREINPTDTVGHHAAGVSVGEHTSRASTTVSPESGS